MASKKNNSNRIMLANRDWTQGNILNNLLVLSWPMAVTQTLMTLGPTIDTIWVGRLGPVSMAAVGVAGVAVMLAQGMMMGLTTGMRALIARSIGAKDIPTANLVAQQAIVVSFAFTLLVAIIGGFFSETIMSWVTKDPEIVNLGAGYLRIQFVGAITMNFRMMMDAVMQASGDSMNPMQIAITFRGFHILLCPFMVFGAEFFPTVFPGIEGNLSSWWPFPALGVNGAAYTGIIAQTLGIILGIRVLFGNRSRLRLTFKGFRLDAPIIWRMIRVGLPSAVSSIQRSLNQFIIQIFLAPFGTIILAAHVVSQRIEMILMTPIMSLGQGAGVLVGQNLGANQPHRAEKSAWLAVILVEIIVAVVAIALFFWTIPVIRVFSSDTSVDETAIVFIHIAIVGWIFLGFQFVLMNALHGAGDTMPPMIISIITTWLITIPLAYFLPKFTDYGVLGIRWALTVSMIVGAAANVIYFRAGTWKTRRV